MSEERGDPGSPKALPPGEAAASSATPQEAALSIGTFQLRANDAEGAGVCWEDGPGGRKPRGEKEVEEEGAEALVAGPAPGPGPGNSRYSPSP